MEKSVSPLVSIGKVHGPHGIKGWVKISSFTEPQENLFGYPGLVLKGKHGVKPLEFDAFELKSKGFIAKIKGVDDRNQSEALGKVDIAIPKDAMPSLGGDDYYWHQLIGLRVVSRFDGQEHDFGVVDNMISTGANDVISTQPDASSVDDQARLVPYVFKQYVLDVSLERGVITVEWDPEF